MARYAVTSQRSPLLTETIILAGTVHRALVELSDGSQVFTGCDSSHRPLQGHAHAHIFCESNPGLVRGGLGEITNITVFAPMGFDLMEQEALQRLKEVYIDCESSIQLVLQGLGGPENELLRLLLLAGFPEPETVKPVPCTRVGGREVPWHAFVRRREIDERRPAMNGAGSFSHNFSGFRAGVTRANGKALEAVQATLTPRPRGTIYEAMKPCSLFLDTFEKAPTGRISEQSTCHY